MPTTRNRWQQEIDLSPEPAIDSSQANQANTEKRRQTSPQRKIFLFFTVTADTT